MSVARVLISLLMILTSAASGCSGETRLRSQLPQDLLCVAAREFIESALLTIGVLENASDRDIALVKHDAETARAALGRAIELVVAVPRFEGDEQLRTQVGALNSSLIQAISLIWDPAFEFSDDVVGRLRLFASLSREQLPATMLAAQATGCAISWVESVVRH